MESNRQRDQLMRPRSRRRQSGITLIGFLLLAAVFGVVGLAVLKVVPLYMHKMRVGTVLEDLREELAGNSGSASVQSIRLALESRFYVENLPPLATGELEIARQGSGYHVRVHREAREAFLADLYFVVVIDEQVEIAQ